MSDKEILEASQQMSGMHEAAKTIELQSLRRRVAELEAECKKWYTLAGELEVEARKLDHERDALRADLIAADKDVASLKGERDALRAYAGHYEWCRGINGRETECNCGLNVALAKLEKR